MNVQTAALCQSQSQPVLLKGQFSQKTKKKKEKKKTKLAEKNAIKSNVSF